jgi:hypothetical protein
MKSKAVRLSTEGKGYLLPVFLSIAEYFLIYSNSEIYLLSLRGDFSI